MSDAIRSAIDAVWRIESARLIAALARMTGDLTLAEDCAQDALVAALEQWPAGGVPENPGAWLMTAAKRKALDHFRHRAMRDRREGHLTRSRNAAREDPETALHAALDDYVGDDLLRLIFTTCHPVLSTEARVALTLRLLGGLSTEEIGRAFLTPVSTVQQRIVRAKRTLRESRAPFTVPPPAELRDRLADVLEVIYLIFNEGYAATAGDDWVRPALCEDAMRLARILAGLLPDEPEVHGLQALLELQASRLRARVAPDGSAVLLEAQDRSRWDRLLIGRGLAALDRAASLGGLLGTYTLQAAIAASHARASTAEDTDWTRIAALYDALSQLTGSPVVELNRAVAYARAFGPAAGLEIVDQLQHDGALADYPYLPAARGEFLEQLGRFAEARAAFRRAAELTRNAREQQVLADRAAKLAP